MSGQDAAHRDLGGLDPGACQDQRGTREARRPPGRRGRRRAGRRAACPACRRAPRRPPPRLGAPTRVGDEPVAVQGGDLVDLHAGLGQLRHVVQAVAFGIADQRDAVRRFRGVGSGVEHGQRRQVREEADRGALEDAASVVEVQARPRQEVQIAVRHHQQGGRRERVVGQRPRHDVAPSHARPGRQVEQEVVGLVQSQVLHVAADGLGRRPGERRARDLHPAPVQEGGDDVVAATVQGECGAVTVGQPAKCCGGVERHGCGHRAPPRVRDPQAFDHVPAAREQRGVVRPALGRGGGATPGTRGRRAAGTARPTPPRPASVRSAAAAGC